MKTITFFSEKGGVGKSTFSIMYASWLKYAHGIDVGIADFNDRLISYRKAERESIKRNNAAIINKINEECKNTNETTSSDKIIEKLQSQIYDIPKDCWPIYPADANYINTQNNLGNAGACMWLDNSIIKEEIKKHDVMILDFPGSLTGKEFIQLAGNKRIGLIVIPTELEQQALDATTKLNKIINNWEISYNCKYNKMSFINQIDINVDKKRYIMLKDILIKNGLKMLPDMVSFTKKMGKISEQSIMRSTFYWPNWEQKNIFGDTKDVGLTNLFIDVTKELAKTKDYPRTAPTDLSFVNELTKTSEDRRQLNNTSFPEYEI